ncbi:endo-1,4-beta-xylanase [Pseudoneurospora amorphoporcata]|uniref:Beta-xylanase n=1 Tax=Pseudoneurospora amorphoporcata TaxID=241081 RepID=A0AAN6NTZ1_9PEZI|nr:endo-1,4-beta-xylanase [Pseudoneurospora amorphoporcata]
MHTSSFLSLLALAAVPLASAGNGNGNGNGNGSGKSCSQKGLDWYAKKAGLKYFGAATDSPGQRERAGYESAYAKYDEIMWKSGEFGQTTPTNGQKWLFTEPTQGSFNFTEGDVVASLAHKNNKLLRCHALVWHSQLAPWVEAKKDWTKDELRSVIVSHVTNVMKHYKGQCYAWDVVNEAFNEDGTYRESVFSTVLGGEEFIELAFQTASRLDPKAKLYYNDYNLESPSPKTEAVRKLVKSLQKKKIRIDGVGLQAHLVAESRPTLDEHVAAIKGFTELGVEVALTELDVRLQTPANATNLAQQKEAYKNAVGACVQVDGCIGVTIWDFYDPFSWVPFVFTGEGAALLWFEDFSKHPAYDGVVEALTNKTQGHDGKDPRGAKRWIA